MSKKTGVIHFPKVHKESLVLMRKQRSRLSQQPRLVTLKKTIHRLLRELGQFIPIPQKQILDSSISTNLLITIARHGRLKAPVRMRDVDSSSQSKSLWTEILLWFPQNKGENLATSLQCLRHIRKWTLDMGYHLCLLVLMGGSYPLFIIPEKCEGQRHKLRRTCLSQNGATGTQAPSGIWDCVYLRKCHLYVQLCDDVSVLLCLVYLLHVSCL